MNGLIRSRIPSFDVWRGVLCLGMLLSHFFYAAGGWGNPSLSSIRVLASNGNTYVEGFFVISGFFITRSLRELSSLQIKPFLARFYKRRVARIFPPYYGFVILFFSYCAIARVESPDLGLIRLSALTFWANYAPIGAGTLGAINHLWSIAVEEHFYLLWPILYFLIRSDRLRLSVAVGLALLSVFLTWNRFHPQTGMPAPNFSLWFLANQSQFRIPSLAAGSILGILSQYPIFLAMVRKYTSVWTDLLLIAFVFFGLPMIQFQSSPSFVWIWQNPLMSLGFFFIFASAIENQRIASVPLLSRFLEGIGLRSYSIYLWQQVAWVCIYPFLPGVSGLCLSLAFIVFSSNISYRFLELPYYRRLRPVNLTQGSLP